MGKGAAGEGTVAAAVAAARRSNGAAGGAGFTGATATSG